MIITYHTHRTDMKDFLVKRLNNGDVPEPEHVFVPAEEMYMTGNVSTSHVYDPENCWRELFGRHRCIACGKPFWSQESAFDCHPEASAYIVWKELVASRGICCTRSLSDAIRAELSSPYGSFGFYGSGPYGL